MNDETDRARSDPQVLMSRDTKKQVRLTASILEISQKELVRRAIRDYLNLPEIQQEINDRMRA